MDAPDRYSEAATVGMKIFGAVIAVVSFRWLIKIFAGEDGKLNVKEFLKLAGFILFASWGSYMIYMEGQRDHEWQVYGEFYLLLIFIPLLTILHLDEAIRYIFAKKNALHDKADPQP